MATSQQEAIERAKVMMEQGMSLDDANVEIVRMMGVRITTHLDRRTRSALMAGVESGKIGHLKKDKFKPEAFFHPNSLDRAKEIRNRESMESVRSIASVMVSASDLSEEQKRELESSFQ